MKVSEFRPLIDRFILAKVYHVLRQEAWGKKYVCRVGAFVKVLVIIFDKWTTDARLVISDGLRYAVNSVIFSGDVGWT